VALQSRLFRGDPKLEACATQDSAHLTQGARGEHVRKIQNALNLIDAARLQEDGIYGPATARAVLRYKQKRNIVNRSYESQADDIVGRMTIDRLDRELVAREPDPKRDIRCIFPPDANRAVRASLVAEPAPVTAESLVSQARASLPLAKAWVTTTVGKLGAVRGKIERFHVYTADEIKSFEPIETHFKVNIPVVSETEAKDRIDKVTKIYNRILLVFAELPTNRLVGKPASTDKASAPLGGFDLGLNITIGSDFANSNENMRAAVLIHEAAHFVDTACSHAASEQPAPDGSPIEDAFGKKVNPSGKNYAQLDFSLHIQNAYSFAQCAMHNGLGRDQRPP
jgi:peptidoglycan hydrolase-like protein with peptidoglycan-binding domain